MNGQEWNEDDKRLFEKIKQDAIENKFVYGEDQFRQDIIEFRDALRKAFGVHDKIETRIHVSTDKNSLKIDKWFYAWMNSSEHLVKAYRNMERDKL